MKRNIYISFIQSESFNYKFKMLDKYKGRKYKFSDESYDITLPQDTPTEESLLKLAKNIAHSEVTIVFITRGVLESAWIPLEVKYSLELPGDINKASTHKGILAVVIPDKGNNYGYALEQGKKGLWRPIPGVLPAIITDNMFNEKNIQNKYNVHYESYISVYRWEELLRSFDYIVEAAYNKATNFFDEYNVTTDL